MEELYERILALVESQELHRSSNGVLHEEYAALVEAVNDVAATFAKVEEVREAVNQLEQGKPSTGRSASLLDVMDSTMQLQQELHNTLKKVAAGMKVEDVPVKRKRSEEQVKKEKEQESSASSDSSASSSSEEEVQTKKHKRQEKGKTSNGSKKQSADLSLAHDALSTITKVKTANRRIEAEMKDKWAEAIFDAKRILKHQSACDAHTTDNAATEVTARALETAIVVFQKLDWTAEHAKEVRSVIAALSDACSKNAVLRIFFHRARAQLESLEMSIPASLVNAAGGSTITKPAATGSSLEDLLRTYDNLSRSMHTQPPRVKPKRIVEALSAMQQVMADDFMCAHAENVRTSAGHVCRWIGDASLQNDLVKEYRRFANGVTAYSKKFPEKQRQLEWQRIATSVHTLLDEKFQPSEASNVSLSWSKKTNEKVGCLASVRTQVKKLLRGSFSLDQVDNVMKTLNEIVSYRSKEWNPLADPAMHDCLKKLASCIKMIRNQSRRGKRLKTVSKWETSCSKH